MILSLKDKWICSQERGVENDVLPVVSSHVETVCLLCSIPKVHRGGEESGRVGIGAQTDE